MQYANRSRNYLPPKGTEYTMAVDLDAAARELEGTVTALEAEIATDQEQVNVKKARLAALKRAQSGLRAAADPDIAPVKPRGRKKSETEPVAA
jgi:hypothetical protein